MLCINKVCFKDDSFWESWIISGFPPKKHVSQQLFAYKIGTLNIIYIGLLLVACKH